jgi:hypothetical protein
MPATGLLIVSGGNEIRSGAHAGQAALAAHFAAWVIRSSAMTGAALATAKAKMAVSKAPADIAAAVAAFRAEVRMSAHHRLWQLRRRNVARPVSCRAAIDRLVLANPWVIEASGQTADEPTPPSAAAVRARYWARLKNPRSLLDLLTGKIDLRKLARGLKTAATNDAPSQLAARLAHALGQSTTPATILIAERDSTALAFLSAWASADFAAVRSRPDIHLERIDSASHSFADAASSAWLRQQIAAALNS